MMPCFVALERASTCTLKQRSYFADEDDNTNLSGNRRRARLSNCGARAIWCLLPTIQSKTFNAKLQSQPELFFVGIIEERIVASVMAGYDGHRGWLYYLAVHPEMQRQGLGRLIVSEAEVVLQGVGLPKS